MDINKSIPVSLWPSDPHLLISDWWDSSILFLFFLVVRWDWIRFTIWFRSRTGHPKEDCGLDSQAGKNTSHSLATVQFSLFLAGVSLILWLVSTRTFLLWGDAHTQTHTDAHIDTHRHIENGVPGSHLVKVISCRRGRATMDLRKERK